MATWPQVVRPEEGRLAIADQLARAARDAADCREGRLLLRHACEAADVEVENGHLAVGDRQHTAMLVPTVDGFPVVVDGRLWQEARQRTSARRRLRFVVAHELGHTFFYRSGRPPSRDRPADRFEERFCHRFATALLVPPSAALSATVDPSGLHDLADTFDVSSRVAAWAIARARRTTTLLWLSRAPHPVRGGNETMRVEWGAGPRFIAPGESFKSGLVDLVPGQVGETTENLQLAGRVERVRTRAWRFASSMLAVVERCDAGPSDLTAVQNPLF